MDDIFIDVTTEVTTSFSEPVTTVTTTEETTTVTTTTVYFLQRPLNEVVNENNFPNYLIVVLLSFLILLKVFHRGD